MTTQTMSCNVSFKVGYMLNLFINFYLWSKAYSQFWIIICTGQKSVMHIMAYYKG